ncbi:MAG: glycoside hydrolase family 2, partial [Chitinophagaceae bacterium]
MERRKFIVTGSLLSAGSFFFSNALLAQTPGAANEKKALYSIFKDPETIYRPFVRWWWNGNKVEKAEIIRELKLLKEAGIGGVEINPIKFPPRTDDLGIPTLRWLSPEWIDILDFTLEEAKKKGIICDLIVGSGWPFGAEYLEGDERADIITVGVKKVTGMMDYEVPLFDFLKEADPA